MPEVVATSRLVAVVPNLLSILRIGLAVIFPLIPAAWQGIRVVVVVAGGASDWIDGRIARRYAVTTPLGGLLDAVADKLFVFMVIATLTWEGQLLLWQAAMVLARDFAIAFVAAYAAAQKDWPAFKRMRPRPLGKVTTFAQFALILAVLIQLDKMAMVIVAAVTIGVSLLTASDYLYQFALELRRRAQLAGDASSPGPSADSR
ncbi:MAG: CDP-alcohol phosphatidyltransferase family protein [Planctomycetes bacterium]|nr:CDP-alcohol phosphatidyltransferase family protein [Planctomycetota bacterium]